MPGGEAVFATTCIHTTQAGPGHAGILISGRSVWPKSAVATLRESVSDERSINIYVGDGESRSAYFIIYYYSLSHRVKEAWSQMAAKMIG